MKLRNLIIFLTFIGSSIAFVYHIDAVAFILSTIAIIPLAGLLGKSTEEISLYLGPRTGGMLNATLGNAAELIIGFLLITKGEISIVRASLMGSILSNLLLVLGASFFFGGVNHKDLSFSARAASTHVASMTLAVSGLILPSVFSYTSGPTPSSIGDISIGVGIVLIVIYASGLFFSLVTHKDAFGELETSSTPNWSIKKSVILLSLTGILLGWESYILASTIGNAISRTGLSGFWIGLIILPIAGNAAEHYSAIMLARRNNADLSLNIAIGSSTQVALVVTPLLVFSGALLGHPLNLVFSIFELAALVLAVIIVALITLDGQTDWFEGVQLLGVYIILVITSFFITK